MAPVAIESPPENATRGLTAKQKWVWVLVALDGVPQVEIARKFGVTPESVCRLFKRAEAAIRPWLRAFQSAGGSTEEFRAMLRKR